MNKEITAPKTYLNETLSLKKDLEKTFILLAERLYNIFTQNLWKDYDDCKTFEEFLLYLKMSPQVASKLITVYKTYVIENKIPISKLISVRSWEGLYHVRSLVTSEDKALELVESGAVLSDKDMRALTKENVDCKIHDWYKVRICSKCNERQRIYEE